MADWKAYYGNSAPHDRIKDLPERPPWRQLAAAEQVDPQREALAQRRGPTYCSSE